MKTLLKMLLVGFAAIGNGFASIGAGMVRIVGSVDRRNRIDSFRNEWEDNK